MVIAYRAAGPLSKCWYCDELVFVGDRVYDPDGFPYLHVCVVPPPVVPNERDFAPGARFGAAAAEHPPALTTSPAVALPLRKMNDQRLHDEIARLRQLGLPAEEAEQEAQRRIDATERDARRQRSGKRRR